MTGSPFRDTTERIKLYTEVAKEGCDHMFDRMTKDYIKIMLHYLEITRDYPDLVPPALEDIFHMLANINPMAAMEYYEDVKEEILDTLERTMDDENNLGAYNCGEWGKALRTDIYEMYELCRLICVRRYGEGSLERRYAKHKEYLKRTIEDKIMESIRKEGIISTVEKINLIKSMNGK
jgi:hypothetical protein